MSHNKDVRIIWVDMTEYVVALYSLFIIDNGLKYKWVNNIISSLKLVMCGFVKCQSGLLTELIATILILCGDNYSSLRK